MNYYFKRKMFLSNRVDRLKEKRVLKLLVAGGLVALGYFTYWFTTDVAAGPAWLYWPLTLSLFYRVLKLLHEWYHYVGVASPPPPGPIPQLRVDMLTTACPGEPYEMIAQTLRAMVAVRHPHTNYLCDEGDDPHLRQLCAKLGVVHVTRTDKRDAKAGNINNALRQTTGDICVVLDPDHVPAPDFLETVLPYFADEKVGFVQVVQAYGNRCNSLVAKGAAEQTYQFYGPMMMAMGKYGTAQAIGANCTFRRAALDSIGGHAAGLSEDMHTAMRLHAAGWQSVYVPKIVARGLVPDTLAGYYKQQLKWSRGTFDLLFWVLPGLWQGLTWRQKIHYLTVPLYFLSGLVVFIDVLIPILSLLSSQAPWQVRLDDLVWHVGPLLVMGLLIRQYSQRWLQEPHERGFHLMGGMLTMSTWWIYLTGFIYTLLNIKVPYIPTPKDDQAANHWRLIAPNILVCLLSVGAISYGLQRDATPYSQLMASFAGWNALVMGFCALIGLEAWLVALWRHLMGFRISAKGFRIFLRWQFQLKQGLYALFREHAVASFFFSSLALVTFQGIDQWRPSSTAPPMVRTETGAFLVGGQASLAPELATQALWPIGWDWSSGTYDFPRNAQMQQPDVGDYPFVLWTFAATADSSNARLAQLLDGAYDLQLAPIGQGCPTG